MTEEPNVAVSVEELAKAIAGVNMEAFWASIGQYLLPRKDPIVCPWCGVQMSRDESMTARIWGGFLCTHCKHTTTVENLDAGWRIQKRE